jgi:hypothetical protein
MPEHIHDQQHKPPAPGQVSHRAGTPEPGDLENARREFPRYQIDEELIFDRRRYIARRVQPGPGPHTLITSDLTELRAELNPGPAPHTVGPAAPSVKRHPDD